MSDTKVKSGSPSDLEDLANDLDLDLDMDMDAPIGSSFAAALRQKESSATDDDLDLSSDDLVEDILSDFDDDDASDDLEIDDIGEMAGVEDAPASFADAEADTDEDEDTLRFEDDGDDDIDFRDEPEPPPVADAAQEPINAPFADDEADDAEPPIDNVDAYVARIEDEDDGHNYVPNVNGGDRILPRISMHAFCVRSSLLAMMNNIGEDRRMANVALEVHEGGIPAAIQYYGQETTPNLLLIEAIGDRQRMLADLDTLAEHCDENIRVVVVGETNDIRLYRELMDRGVSEYLVSPIKPVQLIRSISALFADPDTPFVGKTLAVTGVKGGVGASAVAHNLAWALSERIKVNSTLVDLDLNFGTTGLDFNQETNATVADALMSPDRFDEAVMGRLIAKASDRLSLLTAPATLDRTYDLDPETYVQVLEMVRGSVPFVVLDLPHIWSDWFKTTVMSSDEIVVVATPDLASLRNGKNMVDFLKAARPNDAPPRLVLNMVGLPKRPEIPPKDFGQAIGLEPSLVLPFDAQLFGTAANNGQMIFDVAPDSKCAQGIDELAATLSGREIQATKGSLIKKILGR